MDLSKKHKTRIKEWLKLGEIAGEWKCPFGESSPMRNVGPPEAGKICSEIFPEIVPQIAKRRSRRLVPMGSRTLIRPKVCCYVCPCNLLGYDEVAKRAKEFVDAH